MATSRSQADYSGTPLARKLGIKEGHRVLLIGAPAGWVIPGLPEGVEVRQSPAPVADREAAVVVAFYRTAADLAPTAPGIARGLAPAAALWVAWPRRAGGHESDIDDHLLREILLPLGVVDVKGAAFDQDWSGLKFVWRRENRPSKGAHRRIPEDERAVRGRSRSAMDQRDR